MTSGTKLCTLGNTSNYFWSLTKLACLLLFFFFFFWTVVTVALIAMKYLHRLNFYIVQKLQPYLSPQILYIRGAFGKWVGHVWFGLLLPLYFLSKYLHKTFFYFNSSLCTVDKTYFGKIWEDFPVYGIF